MRQAINLALTVFCALTLIAPAWASVTPPNGWRERNDAGTVIWSSPDAGDGTSVLIVFGSIEKSSQPMGQWFDRQVTDLNTQGMTISNRFGIRTEGDLSKDVFDLTQDGTKYRAFAFAYDTALGKQMILVMTLGTLDVKNAMLQSAFDHVGGLWRQKVANPGTSKLIATNPDQRFRVVGAPGEPRPSTPPTSIKPDRPGPRCREEMRTINTMQLQQVCYPSVGGLMNCQLQSVPVQQQVLQEQCY